MTNSVAPSASTMQVQACESLIHEHRHVELALEALNKAMGLLEPNSLSAQETLRACLLSIELEMNTHFACEELGLFPAVEPYHSMVLMEAEHEALIALRQSLSGLLSSPLTSPKEVLTVQETGAQFISDMLDHIGREEAGIFPVCEQSLSAEEKQSVVMTMETVRAKALNEATPEITRPERSFKVFNANITAPATRPVFSELLLEQEGYQVKHVTVQAGQSLPAHWSPKPVTIVCLKGSGVFLSQQQTVELSPGTCVEMTPQLEHGITAETDCHLLVFFHS